jgi:hypothetical protein
MLSIRKPLCNSTATLRWSLAHGEARKIRVYDCTASPYAKDCCGVAIEMHNHFAKNAVSTEKTLLKAISMARLVMKMQPCILIACVPLISRDGGRVFRADAVTTSGRTVVIFVRFVGPLGAKD